MVALEDDIVMTKGQDHIQHSVSAPKKSPHGSMRAEILI